MLKINRYPLLFAASLTIISCSDSSLQSDLRSSGDFEITAISEASADSSRTYLNNSDAVLWSAGDAFALMSPTSKERFELSSGERKASAVFKGNPVSGEAPYYAFYPYSEDCSVKDGALNFKLSQHQKYATTGVITPGDSPSIATMSSLEDPAQFKNLCGILRLNFHLKATISAISITDLAGNMLWGDCSLALDGTQGTSDQKISITGGSSTLYLDFQPALKVVVSKVFNIVVPANTLSSGFSVKVYDKDGAVVGFLTATDPGIRMKRSEVLSMKAVTIPDNGEPADVLARGYYKPVFMDAGVSLNTYTTLPAADTLGWAMEYLAITATSGTSTLQDNVIIGSDEDENGVLLYPDGEPRFRMIYVNGGQSNNHGRSLQTIGRSRMIDYVNNGGAYVGTCAGALMASRGYDQYESRVEYLNIWPGHVYHTGISNSKTDMTVMEGCPLLKYYDFGGDLHLTDVKHNGGCYMDEKNYAVPAGTEILMRYDCEGKEAHKKVSCWAYKAGDDQGRIVITGSHPEQVKDGERMEMMAAMMRYATDGCGLPSDKGELSNGQAVVMNDNTNPQTAKLGDGQYHHFRFNLPAGVSEVKVELSSEYKGNLNLSLHKGDFAWLSDSEFFLVNKGATKSLSLKNLDGGLWYVSVYCPDRPTAELVKVGEDSYYKYSGNTEVLNGVAYTLKVSWN